MSDQVKNQNVGFIMTRLKLACVFCNTIMVGEKNRLVGQDLNMSLVLRKPFFGVSDQVRYKPGCTATEDGWTLEISCLGSIGIVLSV